MAVTTAPASKNLQSPDETREFDHGLLEIGTAGGTSVARATLRPGWRWSEHVRPIVGGDSCQVHHTGYCLSGRLGIRTDDGTELVIGPGEVYDIPPGHDGWVEGDESVVMIDWSPAGEDYAKPR